MKKKLGLLVAAAVLAVVSAPSMAQFVKAEDAIKYRQSAFALMGSHLGRMGPVAKKEVPFDAEQIKANVAVLSVLANLPWAGFVAGAEGGDAKPEAFSDVAGFTQAKDKFLASMGELDKAAQAGDFDAFRVAFGNTGKSCKSCHDSYRKEK